MLICDNGVMREMTPNKEDIGNNLPPPDEVISESDALPILLGGDSI